MEKNKMNKLPIQRKMYGCINNRLDSFRCYPKDKQPVVGMGATEYMWTDRHAHTVVKVEKNYQGKDFDIVTTQRDEAIAHRDEKDNLTYTYKRDTEAKKMYFKGVDYKHPDGFDAKVYFEVRWNEKTNRWNRTQDDGNIGFGERREYYDPSF
tara:strand:- start:5418 stop:5873 length:456 start_codon:yes stop_codon:yes gene_type:complete